MEDLGGKNGWTVGGCHVAAIGRCCWKVDPFET